jgi:hypothetical protein
MLQDGHRMMREDFLALPDKEKIQFPRRLNNAVQWCLVNNGQVWRATIPDKDSFLSLTWLDQLPTRLLTPRGESHRLLDVISRMRSNEWTLERLCQPSPIVQGIHCPSWFHRVKELERLSLGPSVCVACQAVGRKESRRRGSMDPVEKR